MTINIEQSEWESTPASVQGLLDSTLVKFRQLTAISERYRGLDRLVAFAAVVRTRPRQSRQVVFVSDHPATRQFKLASGLQRRGWDVVLLHKGPVPEDQRRFFTVTVQYYDSAEAMLMGCMFSPVAYHLFSSWWFETAELFLWCRPGKMVFESYDVLGGNLQPHLEQEFEGEILREKRCFESADGVCSRSLQVQFVRKALGYNIPKKVIFFPEYCWDQKKEAGSRLPKRTDGIHLVFVGGCGSAYFNEPRHRAGTNSRACIEEVTRHGIHYHAYPFITDGRSLEEALPEYCELARRDPLFHLHEPVTPTELTREISQYHAGLHLGSISNTIEGDATYRAQYFAHYTANKAFDYLDAGLPMILGSGRLFDWFIKRTGTAEISYLDSLSEALTKLKNSNVLSDLTQNVPRAVDRYSVHKQAGRLIAFYEQL